MSEFRDPFPSQRNEFGYGPVEREAAEAAERNTPAHLRVLMPGKRPATRRRLVTDRAGETVTREEPLPDVVPDAVRLALGNHVMCGHPVEPPADFTEDEVQRFWAGVRKHRQMAEEAGNRGR